ncbi:MAG: DUF4433 domain-containing protein [Candidatus Calescibacterium sp.]|nr:DUF4433 domain-containing protein [Candidatus Calescibacterium sp.]
MGEQVFIDLEKKQIHLKEQNVTIDWLQHIIHYRNIENVLRHGILSHNEAYKRNLIQRDISMQEVQERRKMIPFVNGFPNFKYSIHDLASLYFFARNPMLYKRKDISQELAIIIVNPLILNCQPNNEKFAIFSDGNVASNKTCLYIGVHNLHKVDWENVYTDSWFHTDPEIKRELSRKICAEVLVYPRIEVEDIMRIWCGSEMVYEHCQVVMEKLNINYIEAFPFPEFFF